MVGGWCGWLVVGIWWLVFCGERVRKGGLGIGLELRRRVGGRLRGRWVDGWAAESRHIYSSGVPQDLHFGGDEVSQEYS